MTADSVDKVYKYFDMIRPVPIMANIWMRQYRLDKSIACLNEVNLYTSLYIVGNNYVWRNIDFVHQDDLNEFAIDG